MSVNIVFQMIHHNYNDDKLIAVVIWNNYIVEVTYALPFQISLFVFLRMNYSEIYSLKINWPIHVLFNFLKSETLIFLEEKKLP